MHKYIHFLAALFFLCIIGNQEARAAHPRIIVPVNTFYIDGSGRPYNQLQPGDTLFFEGGSKNYLQIKNFTGSARLPIVFTNIDGMVTINTDWYYGIVLNNCHYVRLTGTGDTRYFYGFMVSRVQGGAGLSIGYLSSDFEVDHIYISNTKIQGVFAKTDPDCTLTSVRSNFTQYNSVFHDNYISNTGCEGFYIGSSFYSGETITCNGKDTVVLPSVLKGVRVYNNIVKFTGWDGIQVGSAVSDCLIFNNLVMYDSQAGVSGQMSGFMIGGGDQCDCYNNYIYKGKGDAIESLGLGNYKIYNNVIVAPGYNYYPMDPGKMKYGIYVNDCSTIPGRSFSILFNDIINPKTNGIRFSSILSANNLIASNAITGPGAGANGYIVLTDPLCHVQQKNNTLSMTSTGAGFADTTYAMINTLSQMSTGYKDKNATYDHFYHTRPYGKGLDIGMNAYNPKYPPLKDAPLVKNEICSSSDPVDKQLTITIKREPFPDPAESKVAMTYTINSTYDVIIDVYNSGGFQINHISEAGVVAGDHDTELNVSKYPEGVVLFTLRAGKGSVSGKFIKVK